MKISRLWEIFSNLTFDADSLTAVVRLLLHNIADNMYALQSQDFFLMCIEISFVVCNVAARFESKVQD